MMSSLFLGILVIFYYTHNNGLLHCQAEVREAYTHESTLLLNRDPELWVRWTVDLTRDTVTFEVTSKTHGFIGFGLSPHGGMAGMDCVIGGVKDDGQPYFSDRNAKGETEPKIDTHQDWFLEEAWENSTHTFLKFYRRLDTCDDEDLILNGDTTRFIWSLGQTDDIQYHWRRGVASVKVLDPPRPPIMDTSNYSIWNISMTAKIPKNMDTLYWCTVHKSPSYLSQQHIVGFKVILDTPEALEHNHHLALKRCLVDPDSDLGQRLENLVNHPGGACYEDDGTGFYELMTPCGAILYSWAKGGSPLFLENDRGIPLSGQNLVEYIVLDIHLDNPNLLDVTYETGVQIYTTSLLREKEVGLLVIGHGPVFTQVIPPNSVDFVTAGHCSSHCTGLSIPENGLNIFNLYLHTHLSGRGLRVRHFRPLSLNKKNGRQKLFFEELPWLAQDNNYDFDYQEGIQLAEERRLLPGDHLTVECTYDSTWRNTPNGTGTTTIGGFSTRDEMCQAIFWYWPKTTHLDVCMSQYPVPDMLAKFGIDQVQDLWHGTKDPMVLKPDYMANKSFTTILDTMVTWTDGLIVELQNSTQFGNHVDACLSYANMSSGGSGSRRKNENVPTRFSKIVPKYRKIIPNFSTAQPARESEARSQNLAGEFLKGEESGNLFTKYPNIVQEYQAPPRNCLRSGQSLVMVNQALFTGYLLYLIIKICVHGRDSTDV